MPGIIELRQSPRRHRLFFLVLAILVAVLFSTRTALSYYVNALWFGSLGYADVFRKTIAAANRLELTDRDPSGCSLDRRDVLTGSGGNVHF